MPLGPHQAALLDRAGRIVRSGRTAPPGLLFVGPRGSGKQTLARALAESLGAEVVVVSLADPPAVVSDQLIGRDVDPGPAGLLGVDKPTVLYLYNFESLPPGPLRLVLQRAVQLRAYTTGAGTRYTLAPDLFVVGGLNDRAPETVLPPDDPYCSLFRRVDVRAPTEPGELESVAGAMLDRIDPGRGLVPLAGPILRDAAQGPGGLHTLDLWLRTAVATNPTAGPLTVDALTSARDADVEYHLSRIIYRGRPTSRTTFLRWQEQFPEDLRPVTVDLVRHIATRYYVSETEYWDLVDSLLTQAGFRVGEPVVFCHWQATGKSAARVMHDLKSRCRFDPNPDLDVTLPSAQWRRPEGRQPVTFVFADDFIGSGGTVGDLWEAAEPPVPILLRNYPGSRVVVLALAGLHGGIVEVNDSLRAKGLSGRVRMCVGRTYSAADRCLSDESLVLPDVQIRTRLRSFCATDRKNVFPERFRFGYEQSESLVVFHNTVPNNSLAILWYERNGWFPLFPGSGR